MTTKLKTAASIRSQRDARHLMRYLEYKGGVSLEAIAKRERIDVRTVRESVKQIESIEAQNSEGQLQLAVRDLIISIVPQAKATIQKLLTATELVEVTNHKTGKKENIEVQDKTTQLEAFRLVKDTIAAVQPKQAPVSVNVSQVNQTANLGTAELPEERMRRLMQKAREHNQLPAEVKAVPTHLDVRGDDDDLDDDIEDDEDDE